MNTKSKLASALLTKRTVYGLTQEQASEILGISKRWYQKIEKGESPPNLDLICKISKEFNINFADFID